MNIGIVLLGTGGGIGGAEKRFFNLFKYLMSSNLQNNYYFIISGQLYESLDKCGFELENIPNIIKIDQSGQNSFLHYDTKVLQKRIKRMLQKHTESWIYLSIKTGLWRLQIFVRWFVNMYRISVLVKALKLDLLHGILDGIPVLFPYYYSKKIAVVMSYVSLELLCLSSRLVDLPVSYHIGIKKADQLDILHKRIKRGLIRKGYKLPLARTNTAPCSFTDYSRTYSYNKKERIVVFLARLRPVKKPLLFIRSIPKVIEQVKNKNIRFIMAGSGVLEEKVRKSIVRLGLEEYVEVKGFVFDPIDILSKSMIFVQLSNSEAHGTQSLLEAMACENAVVVSNIKGIEEIVDDHVGFRVPLDAEEIAKKIVWLLDHWKQTREMGRKAREKVVSEQTVEMYAEYIKKVYEAAYSIKHAR